MYNLIVYCFIVMLADDHPRCRDGWVPFGTHCYLFVTNKVTWDSARLACSTLGTELATVNYELVNDFLQSKSAERLFKSLLFNNLILVIHFIS